MAREQDSAHTAVVPEPAARAARTQQNPPQQRPPRRWRIQAHQADRIADLRSLADLPSIVAQLLIGRGISDAAAARSFLEPKLTGLRDPSELPGVTEAVELLSRAIDEKRRIVVYGDYDADGMCATA
ncbi:MAG: hypothetical protein K8T25_16235, partial [Planctomycetia bacterium]|nr:hypothetical protein [Planctomycetia bacterium]